MKERILKPVKRWNEWRKGNLNGRLYKILVLLKLAKSPTFELFATAEEREEAWLAFKKELEAALTENSNNSRNG